MIGDNHTSGSGDDGTQVVMNKADVNIFIQLAGESMEAIAICAKHQQVCGSYIVAFFFLGVANARWRLTTSTGQFCVGFFLKMVLHK